LKTQGFLYAHLQHFTPTIEFKSSLPRQEKQEKTLRFLLLFCFLKQPSLRYPAQPSSSVLFFSCFPWYDELDLIEKQNEEK